MFSDGRPAWVQDAVFYQVFPDRFARSTRMADRAWEAWEHEPTREGFKGGDLYGLIEHLDHLERLGVNAIYLNPVFASASNHRYHTHDYFRVDPLLGGDDALRELIDAVHARSWHVLLDGVFNHVGRGFWAFSHLLECGPASPYVNWFDVKDWPLNAHARRAKPNYECWWGLPALPKLRVDQAEVREYLLEVAAYWMRFGIDGWRLDVPEEIRVDGFWESFRSRVREVNPDAYLLGEVWHEGDDWLRGDRFDGLMNYPVARTILGYAGEAPFGRERFGDHPLRKVSASQAGKAITRLVAGGRAAIAPYQLNLLDSHDTPRLATLLAEDASAIEAAVVMQMTLPGAPCIYYGDEVGMSGGGDPACRGGMIWDEAAWDADRFQLFRDAVKLRRDQRVLVTGTLEVLEESKGLLAYLRSDGDDCVLVLIHRARKARRVRLRVPKCMESPMRELWRDEHDEVTAQAMDDEFSELVLDLGPKSVRMLGFRAVKASQH